MKKYLLLMLTLLLCVSLFSCGFNFNEEFIFGEPEVPTAPPQPPISKMEPDVMMHVLNEKGVVFENYDPITEQKIIQMMLTILENDPNADINVPEKYSKQFEQMRGIVRERGTTSTKGFELTTMPDDELFNYVDDYLRPIYEEHHEDFNETKLWGIRSALFRYEKDINDSIQYGMWLNIELEKAYCQIVKDYHGIE
jgi:hypothetical protein